MTIFVYYHNCVVCACVTSSLHTGSYPGSKRGWVFQVLANMERVSCRVQVSSGVIRERLLDIHWHIIIT